MIITLALITIFFISLKMIGLYLPKDRWGLRSSSAETLMFIGVFGSLITFFLGLLFLSTATETYTVETIKPIEIIKSHSTVYVEFENYEVKKYNTKIDYYSIDTNTIFYLIKNYNYFNINIEDEISKNKKYSKYKIKKRYK